MDNSDIIDLLTIVSVADKRTVGEADVVLWHQLLGHLDKDDCTDAIMAHRREQPGVWLEPGHIAVRVRNARRDLYEREDPDYRNQQWPLPPGARRDRHGYIDRSVRDETEYPAEWSTQQRLQATWDEINRARETTAAIAGKASLAAPADGDARAWAMTQIRGVLNKTTTAATDGVKVDVNAVSVRCPFCGSAVSEPCTTAGMPGHPRDPMQRSRAHPSRIEAAAVAMGMTKRAAQLFANAEQIAQIRRYRAEHPANWSAPTGSQEAPEAAESPAEPSATPA